MLRKDRIKISQTLIEKLVSFFLLEMGGGNRVLERFKISA